MSSTNKTDIENKDPTTVLPTAAPSSEKYKAKKGKPHGKHPLHTPWKYWWFDKDCGGSWADSIRSVMEFSTVEEFWSIHGYIKPPSALRIGHSYYVFRVGIKPMWEDEANKLGGRWIITLDKRNANQTTDVDTIWENVLLCLIGEAFDDDGDDVTGLAVDLRLRFDRIAIWTRNANNADGIVKIGKILQSRLTKEGFNRLSMTYEAHKEVENVVPGRRPEPLHKI